MPLASYNSTPYLFALLSSNVGVKWEGPMGYILMGLVLSFYKEDVYILVDSNTLKRTPTYLANLEPYVYSIQTKLFPKRWKLLLISFSSDFLSKILSSN